MESAKDISEFQGILGALISDNKKIGENLFDMIDQLKDRYAILHGIIRGLIAKTDSVSGNEPNKGNIEPPIQSNGQSSSKNDVKSQLDEDIEKLGEQRLMAAMKILPVENLKIIRGLLAQGNNPSQTLKKLQPAIPELSNELINVAVNYPSELKAVIDKLIFEGELISGDKQEGVTLAAQLTAPTTVEPSKPAQTETVSDGQISVSKKAETEDNDKKENPTIKDDVTSELVCVYSVSTCLYVVLFVWHPSSCDAWSCAWSVCVCVCVMTDCTVSVQVNLLKPDDYETEIIELDGYPCKF